MNIKDWISKMKSYYEYLIEQNILLEMFFPINQPDDIENIDDCLIIADTKNIFIIDQNDEENMEDNIEIVLRSLNLTDHDISEYYELQDYLEENRFDLVACFVSGDSLVIRNLNYQQSQYSIIIKKLMNVLSKYGINRIQYEYMNPSGFGDDNEYETIPYYKNNNHKVYYHGTYLDAIDGLLKRGLMTAQSHWKLNKIHKSNWVNQFQTQNIRHEDKVFITTKLNEALFHAVSSARKNKSYPVILQIENIDESKLIIDYDVAMSSLGSSHEYTREYYDDIKTKGKKSLDVDIKKPKQLMHNIGTYGYVGNIYPNQISSILINDNHLKDYLYNEETRDSLDMVNTTELGSLDYYGSYTKEQFKKLMQDTKEEIENEFRDHYEDDEL